MVTLYCTKSSLSSQACLLLIKLLKIEIEVEEQEECSDDINPIMKVPVLVDEELVLTEPRAIMIYLAESSDFYSSDKRKRSLINQRLFYDAAVVFPSLMRLIVSGFRVVLLIYVL
jgi:glutathione S-transferase